MNLLSRMLKNPKGFIEGQREAARWTVPDWTLNYYIARGAYGHTFLGRGIGGIVKVIKVYDLKLDAIDDLKRVYGLKEDYQPEEYLEKLREALGHEAIFRFWNSLSPDERKRILLPQAFISNVALRKSPKTPPMYSYASINEVLETTLQDELAEGRYSSPKEFLPFFRQILEALAIVHKKRSIIEPLGPLGVSADRAVEMYDQFKIVPPLPPPNVSWDVSMAHNDIKPSNIGLDHLGNVVLFDFGIATTFSQRDNYPNVGTITRRAPELHRIGAKPGPCSDVWQAGLLFYEVLTGRNPEEYKKPEKTQREEREGFERDLPDLLERKIPIALDHLRSAGVPLNLVEIVEGCLQTNPEKRFSDGESVLKALDKTMNSIRIDYIRKHPPEIPDSKSRLIENYNCFECMSGKKSYAGFSIGLHELSDVLYAGSNYSRRDIGGILITRSSEHHLIESGSGEFEELCEKNLDMNTQTIEIGGLTHGINEAVFDEKGFICYAHDVVIAARQEDRRGMANLLRLARTYKLKKVFDVADKIVSENPDRFPYALDVPSGPHHTVIPAAAQDGVAILRCKSGKGYIQTHIPKFRDGIVEIIEHAQSDVMVFMGFPENLRGCQSLSDLTSENSGMTIEPMSDFYVIAEGEPSKVYSIALEVAKFMHMFNR